ncbi:AcsD protein [Hahella sp. CCB-MM4]|uniref:IucA/IucC family protein n=1 Tax=Hahella sp. (strain CCB-MM4) TaxID=1926491 RepID=UPI000B9BC0AC|nr:IucA/IucC family protein [Hahella sp. CCB-MM4]OZG73146.1 AcsD protein [Hahella sp. CCB-MM4]
MSLNPPYAVYANVIGEQAACHALLNCLIKEFALPLSLVRYGWPSEPMGLPLQLSHRARSVNAFPLRVDMPNGTRFLVLVDRQDNLGSQYYLSGAFGKRQSGPWRKLQLRTFAEYLLESCSEITGHRNEELMDQILASGELKQTIVAQLTSQVRRSLKGYLDSEQSLWFGHPTHPAPKARLWPQHLQQQDYSPEFARSMRLHQFEVPMNGLWVSGNELSDRQVLNGFANQSGARPGMAIISMHPVQGELFRTDPRVQQLLSDNIIRDLGRSGFDAWPTASLRTLYVKDHDFFIKGSLNVRITNCVRKNAWYELESALIIDRLLTHLVTDSPATTGGLQLLGEPGAISWSPVAASEEDQRWFREQTGAILRRNFCQHEGMENSLMAGTLFGRDGALLPVILNFLQDYLGHSPTSQDRLAWFRHYQSLLLRPVISLFFNHGIVFEPHLQNTIVVHRQGYPEKVLLRDYEGVKLTSDLGSQWIPEDTHPRVKQSMTYPRAQGWSRIAYCLFVNNLSEAVLALTHHHPELAPQMWQMVYEELQMIRKELATPTPELDGLLSGDDIPCKTNFRVRLAGAADKQAGYVQLPSPWHDKFTSKDSGHADNPLKVMECSQ